MKSLNKTIIFKKVNHIISNLIFFPIISAKSQES